MAAGRVLEELFARAPDRHDVTILGAEPRVNYDRIMLSPVLAGEKKFDDIIVHDDGWYARHHVDLRKGETVVAIDSTATTTWLSPEPPGASPRGWWTSTIVTNSSPGRWRY